MKKTQLTKLALAITVAIANGGSLAHASCMASSGSITSNSATPPSWAGTDGSDVVSCDNSSTFSTIDLKAGDDNITLDGTRGGANSRVSGDSIGVNTTKKNAGNDTIVLKNAAEAQNVHGDFFEGVTGGTAVGDSITLTSGAKAEDVYGDEFNKAEDGTSNGGNAITIQGGAQVSHATIAVDFVNGSHNATVTGNNTIVVSGNGTMSTLVMGGRASKSRDIDFSQVTNNITIKDGAQVNYVSGEQFEEGASGKAGDTRITVQGDTTTVDTIYGDLVGGTSSATAGDDIITVNAATVENVIGEAVNITNSTLVTSGDDTVNLQNGATITNNITMDAAAAGIIPATKGGSDTINVSGQKNITVGGQISGGDDVSIQDGAIDNLNYNDYQGTAIDNNNVKGFEYYTLKKSDVEYASGYQSGKHLLYTVDADSTAKYTGASVINANVTNAGTFDLTTNGAVGDTLTIASRQSITGTNGTDGDDGANGNFNHTGILKADVDFANLTSDSITVEGQFSTTGATGGVTESLVAINNVNKATNPNNGDEIDLIVAPNDTNKADENMSLVQSQRYDGHKRQGLLGNDPYIWELKQTDHDNGTGHNWTLTYLKEKENLIRPEIPVFTSLHTIGKELAGADNEKLHTRLGALRNCSSHDSCLDEKNNGFWLRTHAGKLAFDGRSSFALDGEYKGLTLGYDKRTFMNDAWALYSGVFIGAQDSHWSTSGKGSSVNAVDGGKASVDNWNVGAYATAFTPHGTYIDGVIKYNHNKATISAPSHSSSISGDSVLGSVEVGHSFKRSHDVIIEPQAQVTVTNVNWGRLDNAGSSIDIGDHTYVTGRLGVRAEKTISTEQGGQIKPWVYLGVNHEFSNSPSITYGKVNFSSQNYDTAGELRVGVSGDVNKNWSLYGDVGYTSDFGNYESVNGHVGVRIKW